MPYNNVIGRADVAGIIPTEFSNELLNSIEEDSHVLRKGRGLRRMSVKEKKMPVMSALATAYFLSGDTDTIQTSEVNWADVTITAEDLGVIIPVPKNVLSDASVPIWDEIRPELITAMGAAIDAAQLYGTNKPASWPAAIASEADTRSHGIAQTASLYDDILGENGLFGLCELDGYGVTGAIGHMSMRGKLRGVKDTTGRPIFTSDPTRPSSYMLDGVSIDFPRNGAGSTSYPLIVGDWSQLVYSMRQDMEFEVFTEGVITDASNNIVYNLMQQRMAAIMVVMRLGTALPNPINRVNSTEATRYPFAVLKPAA